MLEAIGHFTRRFGVSIDTDTHPFVRVRDVHVAGVINCQSIETWIITRDRHEYARSTCRWIDAQDLCGVIVDDQQLATMRMKAKVKEPFCDEG